MAFSDLVFDTHPMGSGLRAAIMFSNGYGASVVTGPLFYCSDGTYELAVLGPDGIAYDTPVHDKWDNHGVFGHLSPEEVTEILDDIRDIPEAHK